MMFCQKCGKEIDKKAKACPSCGFVPVEAKVRLKNIWRVSPVIGRNPANNFPTDCVACETCMNYCSHFHEGSVVTPLSRIVIDSKEYEWMMHERDDFPIIERTVCHQCAGLAPCMAACKIAGAMSRDEKTGAVLINQEHCSNCRQCEKACPYGAVQYSAAYDKMFKCDLCGGKPQCVEVCPVASLKFEKIA